MADRRPQRDEGSMELEHGQERSVPYLEMRVDAGASTAMWYLMMHFCALSSPLDLSASLPHISTVLREHSIRSTLYTSARQISAWRSFLFGDRQ